MNKKYLFTLLVFVFSARQTVAKDDLIGITLGAYDVGFRFDWTVNASEKNCVEGQYPQFGKPLLLGIWYPAEVKGKSNPMSLKDYVEMNQLTGDQVVIDKTRAFSLDSWFSYTMQEYADSTYESRMKAFDQSLDVRTNAFFEASAVKGKFPVVIYYHGAGGTYDDNALMCEYLASHGYIVVSSSFLSCNRSEVYEGNWRSGASDIQAVLQYLVTLEHADQEKIALTGHSRGSQIGYTSIVGTTPISCFIPLDPTWDGRPYEQLMKDWGEPSFLKYLGEYRTKVSVPILHIASFRENSGVSADSAEALNKQHLMLHAITDLFVHSDRVMLTTNADMEHETFISQGAYDWVRMKPSLQDEEDLAYVALQIQQYQLECEAILKYINAILKPSDQTKSDWTAFGKKLNWDEHRVTFTEKKGKPQPRLPEEWITLLGKLEMGEVGELLEEEISLIGYHQFNHEVMAGEFFRKDRALSKAIIDHYVKLYPDSWKGYYLKGMFAFNGGNEKEGEAYFDQAVQHNPPEDMRYYLENYIFFIW